ncbi:MAG: helix-turn-helix domain-containing protein, partial [Candidatus Aenigmarchaeota archaeon]|nr:helix-turn-helix domain-containing protein [Candidatus Aenigmarchaeota archaeon]
SPMEERYLTRSEVEQLLKVSRKTLSYYLATKQIPFLRISPRKVRFNEKAIEDWLKVKEKECLSTGR